MSYLLSRAPESTLEILFFSKKTTKFYRQRNKRQKKRRKATKTHRLSFLKIWRRKMIKQIENKILEAISITAVKSSDLKKYISDFFLIYFHRLRFNSNSVDVQSVSWVLLLKVTCCLKNTIIIYCCCIEIFSIFFLKLWSFRLIKPIK